MSKFTKTENALFLSTDPQKKFDLSLDSVLTIVTALACIIGGLTLLPTLFEGFGKPIAYIVSFLISGFVAYKSLSSSRKKGE